MSAAQQVWQLISSRPHRASLRACPRRTAAAARTSDKALWESLDPNRKALGGVSGNEPNCLQARSASLFAEDADVLSAELSRPSTDAPTPHAHTEPLQPMRAVDFGTVKCGLAVSVGGLAPRPLKVRFAAGPVLPNQMKTHPTHTPSLQVERRASHPLVDGTERSRVLSPRERAASAPTLRLSTCATRSSSRRSGPPPSPRGWTRSSLVGPAARRRGIIFRCEPRMR